MKNKLEKLEDDHNQHDLEILKAVAQAWHGHSGSSRRTANEFDALRLNFKTKPTRFKLESMNKRAAPSSSSASASAKGNMVHWDFGQSLLDSYEIVSMSKRLESGLVLDDELDELNDLSWSRKRRKESKNSLRNLFNRMSSRRFSDEETRPSKEGS